MSKIEDFAQKHELKLEIVYQDNKDLPEGTILKQSRAEGSVVTPGASLKITVSRVPDEEPLPDTDVDDGGDDTTTEEDNTQTTTPEDSN